MNDQQMTFAETLRCARRTLDLTQTGAAKLLSVSRRTIQHWEDSRRPAPHILAQEGALARLDADSKQRNGDAAAPASTK